MRTPLGKFTELYTKVLTSGDPEVLRVPFLLIGSVGIGKTKSIYYAAKKAGYEVVSFVLSRHRPEHLEGILIPPSNPEQIIAEKLLPPLFEAVQKNDGKVVVFFDEINTAPPAMLNAALSFIQDRELAGVKIPDSVSIVAAGNPAGSDEAYVERLKEVITSRMVVYHVVADLDYLRQEGLVFDLFAPEVLSYLSVFPDAFDDPNPYDIGDGTTKALAVPRTWEALSRYLKNGLVKLASEYQEWIAGFVGDLHASRLMDFTVSEEMIDYAYTHVKFPPNIQDAMKITIFARLIFNINELFRGKFQQGEEEVVERLLKLAMQLEQEFYKAALSLLISFGREILSIILKVGLKKRNHQLIQDLYSMIKTIEEIKLFDEDEEEDN